MNFLTTLFKNIDKLIDFVIETKNKEVKPVYIKTENKSYKNKFNR